MNLYRLLTSSVQSLAETSEAAEQTASVPPAFLVIVGLIAVGFVIMIIQNFVIKKEEYYK